MVVESGKVESDHWLVWWDHSGPGQLTWTCRDKLDGMEYTCRRDDGWRISRRGEPTVDYEVSLARLAATTLVPEEGWIELLDLLEEVVDW